MVVVETGGMNQTHSSQVSSEKSGRRLANTSATAALNTRINVKAKIVMRH